MPRERTSRRSGASFSSPDCASSSASRCDQLSGFQRTAIVVLIIHDRFGGHLNSHLDETTRGRPCVYPRFGPIFHNCFEDRRDIFLRDNSAMMRSHPAEKVGRNDLCSCGSGKKFKRCCLLSQQAPPAESPWYVQRKAAVRVSDEMLKF